MEPEIPENLGFIARLCQNFGFELRAVDPGFNLSEARETANRSQQKLRDARIYRSVKEAVEDLDYVIGTKPGRGVEVSEIEPRDNTSVMIGRESSGLTEEELELCDAVAHIETRDYASLNQSHAAAIAFHSLTGKDTGKGPGKEQLDQLRQLLPETAAETIAHANPSKDRLDRIIGELKKIDSE